MVGIGNKLDKSKSNRRGIAFNNRKRVAINNRPAIHLYYYIRRDSIFAGKRYIDFSFRIICILNGKQMNEMKICSRIKKN